MPIDRSEAHALALDAADELASFRTKFLLPPLVAASDPKAAARAPATAQRAVYLTGNSLGLQPVAVADAIQQELEDWSLMGVEAHLYGRHPWLPYHEELRASAARLVGALPIEVVCMNSLTVNLHLMMTAFYRPTAQRYKIMIEDTAFPSDSHAVASQAELHGFDPSMAIVRLQPRSGETTLRTEDILARIEQEKDQLAFVMLGAVNYLTGQWFDMPAITAAARKASAICGWDLAHAMGNVPLRLHDIGADFACWCSYKYLNAGPGAIAGVFVHERHVTRSDLKHFAGWWGNDPATRFQMGPHFQPVTSADRFQLSNPPIFSLTPVRISLEIFDEAGIDRLRNKSLRLTGYMEELIEDLNHRRGRPVVNILTPKDPASRGCQLSLIVAGGGGDVEAAHHRLGREGVIIDFRRPNVLRAAPVPLYNSFHDVWRFVEALDLAVT